jgi:hypothetical protein
MNSLQSTTISHDDSGSALATTLVFPIITNYWAGLEGLLVGP